MKKKCCQDEVDLIDFMKNIVFGNRRLLAALSLCVFFFAVIGLIIPIEFTASSTIKIGLIGEPLLRRLDVKNRLMAPDFILPVLKKFDLRVADKEIKKVFTVEDTGASNVIKISVKYPNQKKSIDVCNAVADLFLSESSIYFNQKAHLLKMHIGELKDINRRNRHRMSALNKILTSSHGVPVAEKPQIEPKKEKSRLKKNNPPDVQVVIDSTFQSPEYIIAHYKNSAAAAAGKISYFTNESANLKENQSHEIIYNKEVLLFNDTIFQLRELQSYYNQRIDSLKMPIEKGAISPQQYKQIQSELTEYEGNYLRLIDGIYALNQRAIWATDFKILSQSAYSRKDSLIIRIRYIAISACIGFVAGLLAIFLKVFYSLQIKEIFNNIFIRKRKYSYAGS